MTQKGLAPILIVILIALAVGGYLIYTNYSNNQIKTVTEKQIIQPSSSPTASDETVYTEASRSANWKTYTGSSFVFKYPEKWKITPQKVFNEDPESQLYIENEDNFIGALIIHKKGYKFRMSAENPKIPSLQEWLTWNRFIRDDLQEQSCNQKSYGMLFGYECTLNPYGETSFNFIAKTSDQFIEFSNGSKEYAEEFYQILSTFRFD